MKARVLAALIICYWRSGFKDPEKKPRPSDETEGRGLLGLDRDLSYSSSLPSHLIRKRIKKDATRNVREREIASKSQSQR
jgi:hypothetical protein